MKKIAILLLTLSTIVGCVTETQVKPDQIPDRNVKTRTFHDQIDDVTHPFVDIKKATVAIGDYRIKATITLKSLAGPFIVNGINVSKNSQEYSWELSFPGLKDDIRLSLSHFKFRNAKQLRSYYIPAFTQRNLWVNRRSVAKPTITIIDDTITISIDRSAHSSLAQVTPDAAVKFSTYYHGNGNSSGSSRDVIE